MLFTPMHTIRLPGDPHCRRSFFCLRGWQHWQDPLRAFQCPTHCFDSQDQIQLQCDLVTEWSELRTSRAVTTISTMHCRGGNCTPPMHDAIANDTYHWRGWVCGTTACHSKICCHSWSIKHSYCFYFVVVPEQPPVVLSWIHFCPNFRPYQADSGTECAV